MRTKYKILLYTVDRAIYSREKALALKMKVSLEKSWSWKTACVAEYDLVVRKASLRKYF